MSCSKCGNNSLTSCSCQDNCPDKTSELLFDGVLSSITVPEGATLNDVLALLEEYTLETVNSLNLSYTVGPSNCIGLAAGTYGYSQVFDAVNSAICALESDVSSIQSSITTIESDITDIQSDITDLQSDITTINTLITDSMPLGSMIMYSIATAPSSKWELCEGQSLATASYPDLFSLIGYSFGGSGASFNLPDMRGKFFAGYDASGASEYQTIGQGAGANSVTLTAAESGLPAHTHTATTSSSASSEYIDLQTATSEGTGGTPSPRTGDYTRIKVGADSNLILGDHAQQYSDHTHSITSTTTVNAVSSASASSAHENRPEFIVFPWAIKVLN